MASAVGTEKRSEKPVETLTYADVVRLGSLDGVDVVQTALEACAVARQRREASQTNHDDLAQTASSHGTAQLRRDARQRLTRTLEAIEDAGCAEEDARAALQQARAAAYARVAPVIHAEHQHRLPALEASLRVALAAARDVQAVEAASGAFSLPHAGGIAPSKSPLSGRVAEHIVFELDRLLAMLDRIRPSRPAA